MYEHLLEALRPCCTPLPFAPPSPLPLPVVDGGRVAARRLPALALCVLPPEGGNGGGPPTGGHCLPALPALPFAAVCCCCLYLRSVPSVGSGSQASGAFAAIRLMVALPGSRLRTFYGLASACAASARALRAACSSAPLTLRAPLLAYISGLPRRRRREAEYARGERWRSGAETTKRFLRTCSAVSRVHGTCAFLRCLLLHCRIPCRCCGTSLYHHKGAFPIHHRARWAHHALVLARRHSGGGASIACSLGLPTTRTHCWRFGFSAAAYAPWFLGVARGSGGDITLAAPRGRRTHATRTPTTCYTTPFRTAPGGGGYGHWRQNARQPYLHPRYAAATSCSCAGDAAYGYYLFRAAISTAISSAGAFLAPPCLYTALTCPPSMPSTVVIYLYACRITPAAASTSPTYTP